MAPSSSLQIPSGDSSAGPSRHGNSNASRPVSVNVHSQSTPSPAATSKRQRASHTVVSSSHDHSTNGHRQNGRERNQDNQTPYTDVYSHPAAVAYANAHPKRTIPKFGPYLLLQTLGEGEFGKVKLGLHSQWGEEVAVKLIRRGNIDTAIRMSKVEREIEVLKTLKHPNIVRLYDVIETDKYIGIIIEYASGGELFDHILAHRYLREKDAAKLFSQLISGVWYIHQKKIVHRDLKLENLLLDRNRNVLITDFGFANRFEHRSDDLMQTSCGSPCYAAPELVISEGLYVGSAVDIWSCGVILYAMLAGYLPFDDDPANPDGDNINLLYKYIVNTPLSFPDYISEEARNLLSMMLVPDPSRRASLEHVMAHPWLSAYAMPPDDLDGDSLTAFGRTVDDLERSAMEQHQQKRLAYQKQMRAATQTSSVDRIGRSQSHRPENQTSVNSSSRSHSVQTGPSSLLYQTSPEQTAAQSPPPVTAPVSSKYDHGLIDGDDPFAAPPGVVQELPETPVNKGKKAARPHTVQVEYEGPRSGSSRRERATEAHDSERERRHAEPSSSHSAQIPTTNGATRTPEKKRRPSNSETKPLPAQPQEDVAPTTPTAHHRERTSSRSTPRGKPPPVETPSIILASPPETPVVFASPEGTAAEELEKDKESQASSKGSRHNRTPSAVAKFFSNGSDPNAISNTSGSLLTPASEKETTSPATDKKSKRSSLTVVIARTMKGRKGRTATTPVSALGYQEKAPLEPARTPQSAMSPPSSYNEVSARAPVDVDGDDSSRGRTFDMQASTGKARKVMQWFRSRSKARDSVSGLDPTQSQFEEEASVDQDSSAHYRQQNGSSSTVNQRATSVQVTPSTHRSTTGRHTAVVPQRTPSSATDASSVTPSLVTRFRNSVTVGGGSGGHHTERSSRSPAGALRAHHGAVDPDMTTTRPPPEVIKHIKDVLLGMGIEVQLESEYKYRCIRSKKKKLPGTIGSVGGTGSLAAVTMMGTAASNGVDKRGLPVPSHGSFSGGGMLRGLLMRRQSSQVSSGGAPGTYDDADTSNNSVLVSEPGGLLEPVYGDSTEDVGDEVRFSVELTKMTGLSDTFSLDIRRLKGNLRSYKFLYDTIRLRAELK